MSDETVQWEGRFMAAVTRGRWEFVRRTGGMTAVAIEAIVDGRIILVEQYREPLGSNCLELPAGLQRNGAAVPDRIDQTNDVFLIEDRMPAEQALHRFEKAPDAARPFVRNRPEAITIESELLVLGADSPGDGWLRTRRDRLDELIARYDQRRIGSVAGHA